MIVIRPSAGIAPWELAPRPALRFVVGMPPPESTPPRPTLLPRLLNAVERAGNALPHPATLFLALAAAVVVLSWLLHAAGVSAVHPGTGKTVTVVNLLSLEGMHRMLLEPIRNFLAYPPLGISLVCLLGIGIAEHSGLMGAALRLAVLATPRTALIQPQASQPPKADTTRHQNMHSQVKGSSESQGTCRPAGIDQISTGTAPSMVE